jgi:hypothetical protein
MNDNFKTFNDLELIEYLRNFLISRATGAEFDEPAYIYIRNKLINNKAYEKYLPRWIKTCRDEDSFWNFIKSQFPSYQERRVFINEELSNLLYFVETNSTSPIDSSITFDETHLHEQWQKALDRKQVEPEGAITSARALIESVLKFILDEQNIDYNENSELSILYKEVAKTLNLAPEQHQEQVFKQILGGASGVISGLGSMRNKLGDAHGKSKRRIKPSERHSELAVNLAGSMAIFLFKTFKNMNSKKNQ